jgi:cell division protein FtsQ
MPADPLASRRRLRWLRTRARTIVLVVLAGVVVVMSLYAVYLSSWLAAGKVDLTGVGLAEKGRVMRVARVPLGTPLARIDLDAIKARVENLAFVESASVSRSWPHAIAIKVTQRTPVAVVDRGSGLQELDRFGVVFGRRAAAGRLPLIHADATLGSDALAGAGQVAGSLPPALNHRVRYVEIKSADDIELLLRNGQRVLWGSPTDSDQKAEVAQVLLRKKVTLVDVSVPGRPSTRP